MKPGNLRILKVPNPAVRRKMRLFACSLRALSDADRVFFVLAKLVRKEKPALIALGLRGTPRLVGAGARTVRLRVFLTGRSPVKNDAFSPVMYVKNRKAVSRKKRRIL